MAWRRVSLLVAVAASSGVAWAQVLENLPLARTYGSGVHAYFAGDYDRSYDDLTAAIEAGSQDPRTRYFRGLAALRLGRLDEAEADFSEGADLETRALGGWSVSRSLERVQGHDRLRLERHRSRARVAAYQRDLDAERMRYSDTMGAQDDVRRRLRPTTIPAPSGAPVTNLFDGQPEVRSVPAAVEGEPLPAPGDATDPVAVPVEAEPGAEAGVDTLDPQPGMELPPAESANPFDANPAGEPVPSADVDPFGDGGFPPAAESAEPLEVESPAPVEPGQ
jgi:hypothetical protein